MAWHQPRGTHVRARVTRRGRSSAIADMLRPCATRRHPVPRHRRGLAVRARQRTASNACAPSPPRSAPASAAASGCSRSASRSSTTDADASFLVKTKDRFPARLRVHLAATNIRDVVHKRLLHKTPASRGAPPRAVRAAPPSALKLFAYGCEASPPTTSSRSIPSCPGHIDLHPPDHQRAAHPLSRAQGDDQAIRGLLQLLGELFRDQKLAERPSAPRHARPDLRGAAHRPRRRRPGQHGPRPQPMRPDGPAAPRVAKGRGPARTHPRDPAHRRPLVAQCLYDRLDRGNNLLPPSPTPSRPAPPNLLGYSRSHGYKIQSTAGEEWERERRDLGVPREILGEIVHEALAWLLADPDRATLAEPSVPVGR
jgi:hypothetical protein